MLFLAHYLKKNKKKHLPKMKQLLLVIFIQYFFLKNFFSFFFVWTFYACLFYTCFYLFISGSFSYFNIFLKNIIFSICPQFIWLCFLIWFLLSAIFEFFSVLFYIDAFFFQFSFLCGFDSVLILV